MKSAILKPILILLILLVLGSTRQVCVQHEQAALATHVADAISHWKLKSVVVLDFDGSEQSGMLGAGLASDLSNLLVSQEVPTLKLKIGYL